MSFFTTTFLGDFLFLKKFGCLLIKRILYFRMVQSSAYYPNLVACVGYGLRSLPGIVEMKKKIVNGYLGTCIVHCDARIGESYEIFDRKSPKVK